MTVDTKAFDAAVQSETGDFWLASTNPATPFAPAIVNPGETVTIPVAITPSGPAGTVVTGTLYVDDFMGDVAPNVQETGNELAALPYEYTIK